MNDGQAERVRSALALVQTELTTLGAQCPPALTRAWEDLIAQLDLGPSPKLRTCPACGATGMAAATRCSSCWQKLPSLVA